MSIQTRLALAFTLVASLTAAEEAVARDFTIPGIGKITVPSKKDKDTRPREPVAQEPEAAASAPTNASAPQSGERTFAQANECGSVLELQNVMHNRYPNSPYTKGFGNGWLSQRHQLWDQVIALHPEWKSLPFDAAEAKRAAYQTKHTTQQYPVYDEDLPRLSAEFKKCRELGFIRGR